MKFNLHKPCAHCPFRVDCLPGWLGAERASEIAQGLVDGGTFACHETTEGRQSEESQCAGGLIMLLNEQGGFSGAQSFACAMGWLDYQRLDRRAPVFPDVKSFVEHHARNVPQGPENNPKNNS